MTRQTVIAWRARYRAGGIDALADLPRSGRPPVIDETAVVVTTLNPPAAELGVTHWSSRLLAGVGMPVRYAEVARIRRRVPTTTTTGRTMSRRRYVARGVPGGYRIWDNTAHRWWGDLYELCPDELLDELNGARNHEKITALLKKYRALKR